TGSQSIDNHQINQFWDCLSTGVIDPNTQRLYQVCWVSPDKTGSPQTARYFMFVLNVADGSSGSSTCTCRFNWSMQHPR
ncbi:MAG TPA: hypothetical protein VN843_05695, partial [Anaerolineales bacterium]|nr:hypothetical protein [Anaerolineales bacterium]